MSAEKIRPAPGAAYALLLVALVNAMSLLDRQILAILLELIKADLRLSDTQLGLLSGLAFAIFYATLGVPVARLADRSNRRNIIAASLALWSAMTALCGLAQNFAQLLLARIGVGLGVRTPEHVREVASYADAVIVGSAFVAAVDDGLAKARDLVGSLREATVRA